MTAVQLALIPALVFGALSFAAGLIWLERRLLALWQDRWGPNRVGPFGLLQPLADVIKLLTKEDRIPRSSDRPVYVIAPGIVVTTTLLTLAVVPLGPGIVVADLNVGLLFFLAMSSLGAYSVILAGWASNSKYALIGGLRSAAQVLSYEVFMGLSLAGVVIQAGSFNLGAIVAAQAGLWNVIPQLAGFVIFMIAGFAETHRLPFDLPEAESELVAGYHTEYSSMKFALFFVGEYAGITVVSALATVLFLGGWRGPFFPPFVWFLVKTLALVVVFILMRAAMPRPRYDQLMAVGWKLLLPLAMLNTLVTGAVVLATKGGS